jgi:transcription elongation factor SPT4
MPPRRRGIAQPVKKSQRDKYKTVDSNSDEVTPSSESGSDRLAVPKRATHSKKSRAKSSKQRPKLSTDHGSLPATQLQHESRHRQDSLNEPVPRQQSTKSHKELERTLFSDLITPEHHSTPAAAALDPDRHLLDRPSPEQRPKQTPKQRGAQTQQASPPAVESPPSAPSLQQPRALPQSHPAPPPPQQHYSTQPQAPSVDDNAAAAAMSGAYIPPNQHRHMRACMVCSVVRTEQQFKQNGCPNCESFLELAGNIEAIQECTSQVFEGMVTVSDTSKSWVARYQRLEGYVPGVYAVQVEGVLPEEAITAAENAGVHYQPRDGTVNEALPADS